MLRQSHTVSSDQGLPAPNRTVSFSHISSSASLFHIFLSCSDLFVPSEFPGLSLCLPLCDSVGSVDGL